VPTSLLDFLEEMTNRTGLISACIDVFETKEGYLVNEIQTFFGQSDPHQMLVDNIPGRYIKSNEEWIFEAGEFNRFESFELRAQHAQSLWNLRS
jgi:glutathione synthase/RimK-type ligase-like ATP-grasp enzyme